MYNYDMLMSKSVLGLTTTVSFDNECHYVKEFRWQINHMEIVQKFLFV